MRQLFFFINTLSRKGDIMKDPYICVHLEEGILIYNSGTDKNLIPITTEQANNILKEAGYKRKFDWSRLYFFQPKAQLFFDTFRCLPSDIIMLCYLLEKFGVDSISHLKKVAGDKADVIKASKITRLYCKDKADEGKPYFIFLYTYDKDMLTNISIHSGRYKYKEDMQKNNLKETQKEKQNG